jgi:nicotinamide-nucleotide amidase
MTDPGTSPARWLLRAVGSRGLQVACAESLTGGLVAAEITSVPGASASFRGGVVAYATDVKQAVLGVPQGLLDEHGPVAEQTAAAMAQAVAPLMTADLGLATTGVAGPDPVGQHGAGLAFVAAHLAGGPTLVRRLDLPGDRDAVRRACVEAVLQLGLEIMQTGAADGE